VCVTRARARVCVRVCVKVITFGSFHAPHEVSYFICIPIIGMHAEMYIVYIHICVTFIYAKRSETVNNEIYHRTSQRRRLCERGNGDNVIVRISEVNGNRQCALPPHERGQHYEDQ
jgi:hypothetical protein